MDNFLENLQIFFSSNSFDIALKVIISYFGAFWIALIIWVTRDIIHRSNSLIFQIFSIVLNIFLPLFGLIIYLIIRPTKTLWERYYEEMEFRAIAEEGFIHCPECEELIDKQFVYCPNCSENIKTLCGKCKQTFDKKWNICPYCGTKEKKQKSKTK